jgi:hypothetical protein
MFGHLRNNNHLCAPKSLQWFLHITWRSLLCEPLQLSVMVLVYLVILCIAQDKTVMLYLVSWHALFTLSVLSMFYRMLWRWHMQCIIARLFSSKEKKSEYARLFSSEEQKFITRWKWKIQITQHLTYLVNNEEHLQFSAKLSRSCSISILYIKTSTTMK